MRTSAQLVDADTAHQLWAQRYDLQLEDVFSLQDEITERIVAALEPELGAVERERARRKPPDNLDAWDCMLRGRWHMYRFTAEGNDEALRLFRRATELDRGFAMGFASLAFTCCSSIRLGYVTSEELLAEGYDAARTAISLTLADDDEWWQVRPGARTGADTIHEVGCYSVKNGGTVFTASITLGETSDVAGGSCFQELGRRPTSRPAS